ncbi:MAG: transcription antitermination protein NusB [Muribaculaceae bacterium]|nr:transcription antitermination protein NusB [Muribaculaceae bacterium]
MINRELIRIKTVQLLYSYLLVENPFSLESQPSAPTKEKRFAYALYLDLLHLLTRLAAEVDPRNGKPLLETRFIRNVLNDDRIRSLINKGRPGDYPFTRAEEGLAAKIKESGIYRNFLKLRDESNDESFWKDLFEMVVMTDPAVNEEIAGRDNFTLKGVDRMRGIMDETFSNFFASADNIHDALADLRKSMDKTRELYFRLLALPIAMTTLRERDIDNARHKLLKSAEDINPNMRFADNEFVRFLRENPAVNEGIRQYGIDWLEENESLMRQLLKVVMQTDLYRNYIEFPVTDFKTDCEFWRDVMRYIIFLDEGFLEAMEDKSVFWNDDLDVLGTFILKSIKRLAAKGDSEEETRDFVLPMFKDEKLDPAFGEELFKEVLKRKDYYRNLILENIDRSMWEMERLAFMDSVILMTALAEIMTQPTIPLTVSFNEYIEIAKYYSTPKSGTFVNGLLGKIVSSLIERGILMKRFNNE